MIKIHYLLPILLIMMFSPLGIFSQNETQDNVVTRINLGVTYLSEGEQAESIKEITNVKKYIAVM